MAAHCSGPCPAALHATLLLRPSSHRSALERLKLVSRKADAFFAWKLLAVLRGGKTVRQASSELARRHP